MVPRSTAVESFLHSLCRHFLYPAPGVAVPGRQSPRIAAMPFRWSNHRGAEGAPAKAKPVRVPRRFCYPRSHSRAAVLGEKSRAPRGRPPCFRDSNQDHTRSRHRCKPLQEAGRTQRSKIKQRTLPTCPTSSNGRAGLRKGVSLRSTTCIGSASERSTCPALYVPGGREGSLSPLWHAPLRLSMHHLFCSWFELIYFLLQHAKARGI